MILTKAILDVIVDDEMYFTEKKNSIAFSLSTLRVCDLMIPPTSIYVFFYSLLECQECP
jgi:hypothetical protein